jgi:phage protein D
MSSFVRPTTKKTAGFTVNFPTMPTFSPEFRGMRLIQKQYKHDILVLYSHDLSDTVLQTLPTGVPIEVTIRVNSQAKIWRGFVSFVAREEGSGVEFTTRVHCLGSSFPLKKRDNRVFSNVSISEAVAIIAEENGFEAFIEPHPEKFAQLTMAGHSYWEWMVEQAKRIGYTLRVDGSALWFQSVDSTIAASLTDSPEFTQESSYPKNGASKERNMTFFRVLRGDYIETPGEINTEKAVSGVNTSSGTTFAADSMNEEYRTQLREGSDRARFTEYRSDQVVPSLRSAQFRSAGIRSLARYTVPAQAHVAGNPKIIPFGTIQVTGVNEYLDGYWVVSEVEHYLQAIGTYTSEVRLLGDGKGRGSLRGGATTVDRRMGIVNINNALKGNTIWNNSGRQNDSLLRGSRATPQPLSFGAPKQLPRWTAN